MVRGRRGGSAMTAAAVNAIAREEEIDCDGHGCTASASGPATPSWSRVKAARLIGAADVVAYHCARHGRSIARGIAAPYLRDGQVEEELVYPVTTETTDHPGGYQGAIDEFYADGRRAGSPRTWTPGATWCVLAEGDPLFYGSYMHMHKRLAARYPTEVVPGVTSVSAASAALGRPLVRARRGAHRAARHAARARSWRGGCADTDSAAVMKLGRTFPAVRDALERRRAARRRLVRRAGHDRPAARRAARRRRPGGGALLRDRAAARRGGRGAADGGRGRPERRARWPSSALGPAGPDWLTPEARRRWPRPTTSSATAPTSTGCRPTRASAGTRRDNRVEAERAALALDLAARGPPGRRGVLRRPRRVRDGRRGAGGGRRSRSTSTSPVRVLPGLTAAQAVAAAVGAPLGHDYAVISLSDRLKPWEVVAARLAAAAPRPTW